MNEKRRLSQEEAGSAADPFRLIVCERDGHWARHLRGELSSSGMRVHETRSLQECWRMLPASPAALLVVEVSLAEASPLLIVLARLGRDYPAARLVAVADDRLDWAKWAMLEAGAAWFCSSPRRLAEVAEIARRHLAQAPRPRLSLDQKIWAGLPWNAASRRAAGSR